MPGALWHHGSHERTLRPDRLPVPVCAPIILVLSLICWAPLVALAWWVL